MGHAAILKRNYEEREKCSLGLLLNLTKVLHGFWKAKEQNLHTWLYARLTHPFCLLVFLFINVLEEWN